MLHCVDSTSIGKDFEEKEIRSGEPKLAKRFIKIFNIFNISSICDTFKILNIEDTEDTENLKNFEGVEDIEDIENAFGLHVTDQGSDLDV